MGVESGFKQKDYKEALQTQLDGEYEIYAPDELYWTEPNPNDPATIETFSVYDLWVDLMQILEPNAEECPTLPPGFIIIHKGPITFGNQSLGDQIAKMTIADERHSGEKLWIIFINQEELKKLVANPDTANENIIQSIISRLEPNLNIAQILNGYDEKEGYPVLLKYLLYHELTHVWQDLTEKLYSNFEFQVLTWMENNLPTISLAVSAILTALELSGHGDFSIPEITLPALLGIILTLIATIYKGVYSEIEQEAIQASVQTLHETNEP